MRVRRSRLTLVLLLLPAPAGAQPQWAVRPNPLLQGRQGHGLAHDPNRGRTVLFGGLSASTYFSDTWEYDGVSWTRRTPPTTPPARANHALAFDGVRGRVLRLTSPLPPGDAGGPVIDAKGRLVAVAFATDPTTGLAVAVPLDTLRALVTARALDPVPACGGD